MNKQKEAKWLKMAISKLHGKVCTRYVLDYNFDFEYILNKAGNFTLRCDALGLNSLLVRKQLDQVKNMCWYHLLKEERNGTNKL